MALDIPKWMKEDMGFSEAEIAVMTPLITPERAAKIEAAQLRQSDYSKHMNDLKKAQTDLASANERLTAEMADWATASASSRGITEKQAQDLEKAQGTVARLQARVQKIAIDAGLDPAKALEGIDQVVTPPVDKNNPPIDASKFVSAEDHQTALGRIARMSLSIPAEIAAIQHEHHELTGEWLDPRAIIKEIETRATTNGNRKSLEVRDVWEELNGIPEKRTTVAKKKHDDEIAAAEERGRQRALTESQIPGAVMRSTGSRPSPVLAGPTGHGRESVIKRPQPGASTQAAVTALRSHKYRPADAGPKPA